MQNNAKSGENETLPRQNNDHLIVENYDDDDTFLIKEDLKFNIQTKVRSLDDLSELVNERKMANENTINDKNSNTKKLFGKTSVKKLQFKINNDSAHKGLEQQRSSLSKSSGNLHEQLNKLKSDELKKRRMSKPQTKIKSSSENELFCLSFTEFKKNINAVKSSIYCLLERPTGIKGLIYRLFIFTIIFGSIITGALTTIKSLDAWSFKLLFSYEVFVTCYFTLEFFIRLWCVDQRTSYKGFIGRIRFILRPLQLTEMTLIIISVTILSTTTLTQFNHNVIFTPAALSALRFFQIFRFLYIDRHAQTWIILSKVIKQHRFELLSSVYIGVIILLFSSFLILYFEKPEDGYEKSDDHFLTYADAMYWSIITMATIGYGDKSPKTSAGKALSTTLCILGVAFWTLPAGIIGSGFALKVEQKNKKKQLNRLLPAAASLIQAWWRMKATFFISSSNVSCLIATVATFDISKPIYSTSLRRLKRHLDSVNSANEEMSSYFVGLDAPKNSKKAKEDKKSENKQVFDEKDFEYIDSDNEDETKINIENEKTKMINSKPIYSTLSSYSHNSEESSILMKLSPEHLIIIRTILLLKFFRAKQKFKLAFKPYDFKDVIEQYTQGNMDILLKMKDLQRKIDQINNNSSINRALNGESILSGSPPLDRRFIQPGFVMPSNVSRSNSGRREARRLLSFSPETEYKEKNYNEVNSFNERIGRIEIELQSLSNKLDRLFNMKS